MLVLIAILAVITFLAINPARQFSSVRNTQRDHDTREILEAIYQHSVDHDGIISTDITSELRMIGTSGGDRTTYCKVEDGTLGSGTGRPFDVTDDSQSRFSPGLFNQTVWSGVQNAVTLDATGMSLGSGTYHPHPPHLFEMLVSQ